MTASRKLNRVRKPPEPCRRPKTKGWWIRPLVPDEAKGGRWKGPRTYWSLNTYDEAEAHRVVAARYVAFQDACAAEAIRLKKTAQTPSDAPPIVAAADIASTPVLPFMSAAEAVQRYCSYLRDNDTAARREDKEVADRMAAPLPYDRATLIEKWRKNLHRQLDDVREQAVLREYVHADWYITWLENKNIGTVVDRIATAREMTLARIRLLRAMLDDDLEMTGDAQNPANAPTIPPVTSTAPLLSVFLEDYIAKRGAGLSVERADILRAVVRDLIAVVGDKSVDAYKPEDGAAFEDVIASLPANLSKNSALKGLNVVGAAKKAKELGIPRQAASNIRKKWSALGGIFKQANVRHPGHNPFTAEALLTEDSAAANEQWDAFKADELATLLKSDLTGRWKGRLHWLTWLGIYTGARLNELLQISKTDIKQHGDVHYIYFNPDMRLKTRGSKSSVRSVPIHAELIAKGFLDYVKGRDDLLFEGVRVAKTGRKSDAAGKAFAAHLKSIGLKRPRLSFHSLRHAFIARMKVVAPREAETRERLVGHVLEGMSGRYGTDYVTEAYDMELLKHRNKVLQTYTLPHL